MRRSGARTRIALAAFILLMPGGFILGGALLIAWVRKRRSEAAAEACLRISEGKKK